MVADLAVVSQLMLAPARRAEALFEAMLGGDKVTLRDIVPEKYGGRVVARVETAAGEDVGSALIGAWLAVEGGESDPWCG